MTKNDYHLPTHSKCMFDAKGMMTEKHDLVHLEQFSCPFTRHVPIIISVKKLE